MKKSLSLFLLCICFILIGSLFRSRILAASTVTTSTPSFHVIVFEQEGCGHCANLDAFLNKHSLLTYVTKKNVTLDTNANKEYVEFMDSHKVPMNEQGTPFMIYEGSKWISGDKPIIKYFKDKLGIKDDAFPTDSSIVPSTPKNFTAGDYITLGIGGVLVLLVVGYGILNVVNAKSKR